jgi:hypothetical protein
VLLRIDSQSSHPALVPIGGTVNSQLFVLALCMWPWVRSAWQSTRPSFATPGTFASTLRVALLHRFSHRPIH